MKNLQKLSEKEIELGLTGSKSSFHEQYKDSAWIFIGGLDYDLTEGDIVCVFSQYGEIVNINLVRDPKTGKSKGFAFLCYEDQRSTILAVDNLNGIKIVGRFVRVDHVSQYKLPRELAEGTDDDVRKQLLREGCAVRTPSPTKSDDDDFLLPLEPARSGQRVSPPRSHKRTSKARSRSPRANQQATTKHSHDSDAHDNRMRAHSSSNNSGKGKEQRRCKDERTSRSSRFSPSRR